MARTAPVPNLPPIPGMCPSVAVLAGGGAGGGSGGTGAGDGNGAGPGSGDGNGDQASGDGTGAGSCGTGGNGACTNCGHNISRGDPVNVVTGVVTTVPKIDALLFGPIHLEFTRTYSSLARMRDVGIGFGWSHTFAWRIDVRRRELLVRRPTGETVSFEPIDNPGESSMSTGGWILRRDARGLELDAMDDFKHRFVEAGPDLYLLESVSTAAGNAMTCSYRGAVLERISDSAGRTLRFSPDGQGRVTEVSVLDETTQAWFLFARYTYDEAGDLVAVADALGNTHRYEYANHRLTKQTSAEGLSFHFLYDAEGRCTETWGDYSDGRDASLAASVSPVLADGLTKARGVLHCVFHWGADGYSEVVDSVRVQRFFGNKFGTLDKAVSAGATTTHEFDERGHVVSHTDALGATTRLVRDARGRLLSEINPNGGMTKIVRDDSGRVIETVDPEGGRTLATYDLYSNMTTLEDPSGGVTRFEYAKGLLCATTDPNGARTAFRTNKHGRLSEIVQPNGGIWRYEYNEQGYLTSATDPAGAVTMYGYDAALRLVSIRDADGHRTFAYDRDGQLTRMTFPNGAWVEQDWSGYRSKVEVRRAVGETTRYRYNREGWLVEVHNSNGEVHELTWNERKNLVSERTFDGSQVDYRYDLMNRVTRFRSGGTRWTQYVRDPMGQVQEQVYPDGSGLRFTYDRLGRVETAKAPKSETTWTRGKDGRVAREAHLIDGVVFTVEYEHDPRGQLVAVRTSEGHVRIIQRDALGAPIRETLDGAEFLSEVDVMGRETRRLLPEGGVLETTFDPLGRVAKRRAGKRSAGPLAGTEPAWVGGRLSDGSFERAYAYNSVGDLIHERDAAGDGRVFEVDLGGRILRVEGKNGTLEQFRYDDDQNVVRGADAAAFGRGGRLARKGGLDYSWDDSGQLRSKIRSPNEAPEVEYVWADRGTLSEVRKKDGTRVTFLYDAFARRTMKRVTRRVRGRDVVEKTTYFVWAGGSLVHEVTKVGTGGRATRTYAFDHRKKFPLAHSDAGKPWLVYVLDPVDAPAALVRGDGAVEATIQQGVYGDTSSPRSTPILFPGQYYDEETGLAYNFFRYYDPEDARFISADPVRLDGAINTFAYVPNPTTMVDPLGLGHEVGNVRLTFGNDGPTVTPGAPHATHNSATTGRPTNFYSGYRPRDGMPGREDSHCGSLPRGQAYWESHTERKSMRWAEEEAERQGRSLDGSHLEMTGRWDPCNTCNAAMERWTQAPPDGRGASVTYRWPTNQSRRYSGGSSSGCPRTSYV